MSLIRRMYTKFVKKSMSESVAIPDTGKWAQLLNSMPAPKDGIDVAYNKHLCRMSYFSVPKKILMNVLSAGALILSLPKILKKVGPGRAVKKGALLLETQERIGYHDVVPQEMLDSFKEIAYVEKKDASAGPMVDAARKLFFQCVRRHPFSFWFIFLVQKELALHSSYLQNYDMEACALYVYEKPTAGPVVTELYEATGRRLISFMHGEYLLQLPQCYMKFSEYYVWDEAYADMFKNDLNCHISKYTVYAPLKLQKKWHLEEIEPEYFCTYYFSSEKLDAMYKIAEVLNALTAKGYKCKVRPHPRATTYLKEMEAALNGVYIEAPREISMHDSLAGTMYAAGTISTVLSEAYVEGRKIVIDDVSDPAMFGSLRDRKAIVLTKEHMLLSELCRMAGLEADHAGM